MSTSTFLRSLKRFTARRGLPRKFVSDNGKTFEGASKVIRAVTENEDVQKYLSEFRVEWAFNLEWAPWWGGLFELTK